MIMVMIMIMIDFPGNDNDGDLGLSLLMTLMIMIMMAKLCHFFITFEKKSSSFRLNCCDYRLTADWWPRDWWAAVRSTGASFSFHVLILLHILHWLTFATSTHDVARHVGNRNKVATLYHA